MIKRLAVSVFVFASTTTAVFAAAPYSAQPATPVADAREVTTETVIWSCRPSGCVTTSSLDDASPSSACRELKREVGPLANFNSGRGDFTPAQLAACNGQAVQKTGSTH